MSKQNKNLNYSLLELADILSANLNINNSDPNQTITGISTLKQAKPNELSFYTNKAYKNEVLDTKAGVVITSEKFSKYVKVASLIVKNPHHAYSIITQLFCNNPKAAEYINKVGSNIHPTAIVGDQCNICSTAYIGPYVVLGNDVTIGAGAIVHAHTTIGNNCSIGDNTVLHAKTSLYNNITIGNDCIVHSGAIIGADGFGFALTNNKTWSKVEQLGGVTIGNNVEIGANTAIDCGALEDTIIGDGVKLDNQLQVGHNVIIGKHCVFAAQVAIGGSTKIGDHCAVGGASTIAGHLDIAPGVNLAGTSVTGKSITEPGVYASGTGSVMPFMKWRRMTVHLENLDKHLSNIKGFIKSENLQDE